tara:strand:+ start:249 stop:530 length:282 start_codon:yes stop_codon:yes gene_type:complete
MLELVQIKNISGSYTLSTVFVNPSHIVHLSEHTEYSNALREGKMNLDLNPITTFTKLVVNEGDRSNHFIVIGDPSLIESKLNKSFSKRKILRG